MTGRIEYTSEMDAFLLDLYAKGLAMRAISVEFYRVFNVKKSRNAIIGRLSRIGANKAMRQKPKQPRQRRRAVPAPKTLTVQSPAILSRRFVSSGELDSCLDELAAMDVEADDAATDGAGNDNGHKRVALLALKRHQCHFPLGTVGHRNFGYCGEPIGTRGQYCDAHAAKMYVKVTGPRNKAKPNTDRVPTIDRRFANARF